VSLADNARFLSYYTNDVLWANNIADSSSMVAAAATSCCAWSRATVLIVLPWLQ